MPRRNASPILPVSARADFVALPSDPAVPLTPEQLSALFAGDVEGVLRELYRLVVEQRAAQQNQHTPLDADFGEGAVSGRG